MFSILLFPFLVDCRSGEPTLGKTQPETILRQLTTKKGQVRAHFQKCLSQSVYLCFIYLRRTIGGMLKCKYHFSVMFF